MSFKLKTILLLIVLSLSPYLITMGVMGNAYRDDYEARVVDNMQSRLQVTVERLDQHLQTLEKDLRFIGSLDVMNDVLTGGFDRRISMLLLAKKRDLQLIGDIDVINDATLIIASSDMTRVGNESRQPGFIEVSIASAFTEGESGRLILRYDLANLERFFGHDPHLQYRLLNAEQLGILAEVEPDKLLVTASLATRPELAVVLQQERSYALSIIDSIEQGFYFTLIVGVFLIGTIAFLMGNYIVAPILLLSSTAKSITKTQDYTQRVNMDRVDEIGQLSSAFNQMIQGMQQMIEQLKEES